MHDLGMKQQRVERARSASAIAAIGAFALVATTEKPAGAARDEVAVARPDANLGRHAGKQRRRPAPRRRSTATVAWPNSRCGAGATRPPSVSPSTACRSRCRAPGMPMSNSAGSHFGAPGSDTLFGPPDRMMPDRLPRADLLGRRVRRPDLGIHRQLAQPPRDQLRVLRPEIENDDGLMAHGRDREVNNAIITVCATRRTTRCCSAVALSRRLPRSILACALAAPVPLSLFPVQPLWTLALNSQIRRRRRRSTDRSAISRSTATASSAYDLRARHAAMDRRRHTRRSNLPPATACSSPSKPGVLTRSSIDRRRRRLAVAASRRSSPRPPCGTTAG